MEGGRPRWAVIRTRKLYVDVGNEGQRFNYVVEDEEQEKDMNLCKQDMEADFSFLAGVYLGTSDYINKFRDN